MAWTSLWSDSRQCQVGNQALNTMRMGTEGTIESETGDRGWMRLEMIIALVHMANVALMLSMLTLLGFATNNTQISPGLTLKNPSAERAVEQKREREGDWERERGPLSHWWHQDAGISAWQLAPGMGFQRPQQLPAFSDLWLYDKWRLHITICNPPVCVSHQ